MLRSNVKRFEKIVYFGDCDEAGVIHFYKILRWSHEFWELSLINFGIELTELFPCIINKLSSESVIFPIYKSESKFLYPIRFGDKLIATIDTKVLSKSRFEIITSYMKSEKLVAQVTISHCSLKNGSREKTLIPSNLLTWLED